MFLVCRWVSRESLMTFKSRPVSLTSRLANFYFYFFDISIYARQLAVEEKSYHSSSLNCNRKFLSEKKSRVMRESKTTKTQQLDEESEKKTFFRHPWTKNRPDESAANCDIEWRKTISLWWRLEENLHKNLIERCSDEITILDNVDNEFSHRCVGWWWLKWRTPSNSHSYSIFLNYPLIRPQSWEKWAHMM